MTNKLPEKLSALRKSFSFAQMDVASKIGVPVSEYMKWENGNSVCGIEILRRIAQLYDVNVQDLFLNTRELKMPDVEFPYASVEIPFVEQASGEEESKSYYEDSDSDEYDSYDDEPTVEQTKQFETEEDLAKTKLLTTDTLQATSVMKIQEDTDNKMNQNTNKKTAPTKKDPKKIGIIAGIVVVLVVLIVFACTKLFKQTNELSLTINNEKRLVSAETYSAYITNKGKLITSGDAPSVSDFDSLAAITTDGNTLVGLKKNGTVISSGSLPTEVGKWKNITDIAMSNTHYVGVKEDGSVACAGDESSCKVEDWSDISKVYAGENYTIGINKNGRILVSGDLEISDTLEGLSGVKNITLGEKEVAVLFTSGKVNTYSLDGGTGTNTGVWSNITAVAVGNDFVAGITDKEAVVIASTKDELSKEAAKWAGVKYIAANGDTLIAVNSSDQIIGVGDNTHHQYNNLEETTPTPSASSESTLPPLASVQNIKCNVSATGLSLNWDSVVNVSYYEVSVNTSPNEIKIKSAGNSASIGADKLTDGQTYKITIVAYPKDIEKYSKSEAASIDYVYSSPVKKLATPANIKYTQNGKTFTFTWDAVENATSYTFTIGTWETETTSTSMDVDGSNMANGANETAYISAKSSDAKYSESDAANIKFTYNAPVTPLVTPTITSKNVNIDSGDLSITWTKDEHASNYTIAIGTMSFTSDSGTLVVKADQLNSNTDYRIVITANPADTNSYSSSSYEENYKYEYTKQSQPTTPTPTQSADTEG